MKKQRIMKFKKPSAKGKLKKLSFRSNFNRASLIIFALVFANIGALTMVFTKAALDPSYTGHSGHTETHQYNQINYIRKLHGLGSLRRSKCLADTARAWAKYMGDNNFMAHSNSSSKYASYNYVTRSNKCSGGSWRSLAENVGNGPIYNGILADTSTAIFQEYLKSSGHKANILGGYNLVGVGTYRNSQDRIYTAQVFAQCSNCSGSWIQSPSAVGEPWPKVVYSGDAIKRGVRLNPNTFVLSKDKRMYLEMRTDGTILVWDNVAMRIDWHGGVRNEPGAHAVFQGDGNLILKRPGGKVCHTGTNGKGGSVMYMQSDKISSGSYRSNLVMYGGGKAIWDTRGYTNNGSVPWYCS